jgi:hypothetical protein
MNLRLVWIGLAAFLLAVLVVLPARWMAWALPAQVQCATLSGSVWHGQCDGLTVQQTGAPLEIPMLRWKLHPLSLLRLTVNADFSVRTVQGTVSGAAELGRKGRMAVRNLAASALFDRRLATMLADGWNGQLEARDLAVEMQGNMLKKLSGEMELRDFKDAQGAPFGSYRLVFTPADAPPFAGTITDTGGPLAVTASVTVSSDRRWQLDGLITPRAGASPEMRSRLEMLAAPDASGAYRLQSEGTFK